MCQNWIMGQTANLVSVSSLWVRIPSPILQYGDRKEGEIVMIVYYLVRDCGDGSVTVDFFRNPPPEELMAEEEYCMNGEQYRQFEIPDGPNTIRFCDNPRRI